MDCHRSQDKLAEARTQRTSLATVVTSGEIELRLLLPSRRQTSVGTFCPPAVTHCPANKTAVDGPVIVPGFPYQYPSEIHRMFSPAMILHLDLRLNLASDTTPTKEPRSCL
jgi:hypothetical protein